MRIYHGQDLRRGRYSQIGRPYLLTTVTSKREDIFRDWQLGRLLVNELKATHDGGLAESLAWVIMPDHLHWLCVLNGISLDALMRRVKSGSALRVNRRLGRSGPLWQRGYHDHAVRAEEDIREIARYVIANPLRARLVRRLGDYPLWDAVWL
ncbi:MAG: transposase [Gammaproteobacteria bacterium]|nr:transposase [Gammaproteobacteria bacterium]NIR84857.1 transposase [Gammaproteobacteria bacterium]NIR91682.1 transposase [Gammaproteobacteria bacterium]NIU05904.1 transposase [Gammaproteobacteria bacterium]NIV52951.1 transposase [Gammaproteobacteria bacterium]